MSTLSAPDAATPPVIRVENLKTHFFTKAGVVKAVDGVDFSIAPGEILGLVGESGSGKSMTGYSLLGLIDAPGRIVEGNILFAGRDGVQHDLRSLDAEALRQLRGNRIAMIFQDPMMTLNPVLRIDTQMIEAVQAHRSLSRAAANELARDALHRVGIPSPDARLKAYPHELSGGMRQRVAIAIAMLNQPDLIICDEPTTALDVTIQGQILYEMQKLCRESGTALLWITHDLSVVAGLADKVAVMYAGRIVESGSVEDVLHQPLHPYTAGLIASTPAAANALALKGDASQRSRSLLQIPGMTPSLLNLPQGCAFRPRCSRAQDICLETPPAQSMSVNALSQPSSPRQWRCFNPLVAQSA